MLHSTRVTYRKIPRNMGVGPQYDTWWKKYDAWNAMNRMRRMVGTGFYIPPEWYLHFRMFPPPHNLFVEEQTQNPFAHSENQPNPHANQQRMDLRDMLAKRSRTAASAGNRYMNLFWVAKPLDEMERSYYKYTSEHGMDHDNAIAKVVTEFHAKEAVRRRVQALHLEEAKLTGKFITMREGMAVLHALNHVQNANLAPHQYASLARSTRHRTATRGTRKIRRRTMKVKVKQVAQAAIPPSDTAAAPAATTPPAGTTTAATAETTTTLVETEELVEEYQHTTNENLVAARERIARGSVQGTREPHGSTWYGSSVFSPTVDLTPPPAAAPTTKPSLQSPPTTGKPATATPQQSTPTPPTPVAKPNPEPQVPSAPAPTKKPAGPPGPLPIGGLRPPAPGGKYTGGGPGGSRPNPFSGAPKK